MKQINFQLPTVRKLPIVVTYTVGLVCENRPDLADEVRASVLRVSNVPGDLNSMGQLAKLSRECATFGDEQGAILCKHLSEIVHYGGNDPKALHRLADVLGLIPTREPSMSVWTPDSKQRIGTPTIGDVYCRRLPNYFTVGMGGPFNSYVAAMNHSGVLVRALTCGLDRAWERLRVDGAREALRRLIPLYAHTIALDADVRAAWAKAHLDALNCPTE